MWEIQSRYVLLFPVCLQSLRAIQIAIPYPTVVDVEKSNAMDFSETIEIKVQDRNTDLALDSYFFAYFQDLPKALEQIRDAVRTYRAVSSPIPQTVVDTTTARTPTSTSQIGDRPTEVSPKSAGFRLTSLLRPLQETLPITRTTSAPNTLDGNNEDFTHIIKRGGASFVPITTTVESTSPIEGEIPGPLDTLRSSASSLTPAPTPTISSHHTYPPSTSASSVDVRGEVPASAHPSSSAGGSSWSVGMPSMPSWLRVPSRTLLWPAAAPRPPIEHASTLPVTVTEVVSSAASSSASSGRAPTSASVSGEFGFFSILETPETTVDPEVTEKFRTAFAFDEKENVLGSEHYV